MKQQLRGVKILFFLLMFITIGVTGCNESDDTEESEKSKTHLKIFFITGQSNATGIGLVSDLPEKYKKSSKSIKSFTALHVAASVANRWLSIGPGLGATLELHGCELSLADKLATLYPEDNIAIIKCTLGGSVMETQWISPSAGNPTDPDHHLFEYFENTVNSALNSLGDNYTYEIAGMVWMQGESDGTNVDWANKYESNLTWFIKDMRSFLNAPKMPFVIGKISEISYWPFANIIRQTQDNVALNMENVGIIDANIYPIGPDNVHYTSSGLISMGNDFAVELSSIINKN